MMALSCPCYGFELVGDSAGLATTSLSESLSHPIRHSGATSSGSRLNLGQFFVVE
jgi:hypothetical protein